MPADPSVLERALVAYLDHLESAPWIESLFADHGLPAVLEASAAVLSRGEPEEIWPVLTFVRDISLMAQLVGEERKAEVRRRLPDSVLPALRSLLRHGHLVVRSQAIYTIGKLTLPSEVPALLEVLPDYAASDPVCLVRALGELRWLGAKGPELEHILEGAVRSQRPVFRWAAVSALGEGCPVACSEGDRWLQALSEDPVALIRDHARHLLGQGRKPQLTFDLFEIQVGTALHQAGQADLTLAELEAFAARHGVGPPLP